LFHIRTTRTTRQRKGWRGEIERKDKEEETRTEREQEERRVRAGIGVKTERKECGDIAVQAIQSRC
jgi:hypothetical protein